MLSQYFSNKPDFIFQYSAFLRVFYDASFYQELFYKRRKIYGFSYIIFVSFICSIILVNALASNIQQKLKLDYSSYLILQQINEQIAYSYDTEQLYLVDDFNGDKNSPQAKNEEVLIYNQDGELIIILDITNNSENIDISRYINNSKTTPSIKHAKFFAIINSDAIYFISPEGEATKQQISEIMNNLKNNFLLKKSTTNNQTYYHFDLLSLLNFLSLDNNITIKLLIIFGFMVVYIFTCLKMSIFFGLLFFSILPAIYGIKINLLRDKFRLSIFAYTPLLIFNSLIFLLGIEFSYPTLVNITAFLISANFATSSLKK